MSKRQIRNEDRKQLERYERKQRRVSRRAERQRAIAEWEA